MRENRDPSEEPKGEPLPRDAVAEEPSAPREAPEGKAPRETGRADGQAREEPPAPEGGASGLLPPSPSRDRVMSRGAFLAAVALLLAAFLGGGLWHYRTNILPEKHYREAEALFEARRYGEALELFRRVRAERPERPYTLFFIGRCLEETGRMGEALDAYQRHVQNQPTDGEAWRRMAEIALRMGQPENALAPAEKAVKLDPKDPAALLLSGRVWRALGLRDRATERFRGVLLRAEGGADRDRIRIASKALMELKDYEGALEGYEKLRALDPGDRAALHGRNAARAMLGIPTDDGRIITPEQGIGRARLGATRREILADLGEPNEEGAIQVGDRTYSVLNWHRGADGTQLRALLDEEGRVVQVETAGSSYKTLEGIGTANFLRPRYADRFEFRTLSGDATSLRATLRDGGLTFYVEALGAPKGERRAAVVHEGDRPVDDPDDSIWIRLEPSPSPSGAVSR